MGTPARIRLDGASEVQIGRASPRAITARDRTMTVQLDDRWMSQKHARLHRVLGKWAIEDTGSKNGVHVNGAPTSAAELQDGDWIEMGQASFLFRERVSYDARAPRVFEPTAQGRNIGMVTLSPELEACFADLEVVARSTVPIIVGGPTGSGKELLARAVHRLSGRRGEFVAVNCASLPQGLVESELFGAKRGAFSGATEDRVGLLRAADGGTLMLDEIGDLPGPSQAALLRVLQEREVTPIGATKPVPVDLRVVSATHRPLGDLVSAGQFRADLFARLAGHQVTLPALRDRKEDLGLLVGALLGKLAKQKNLTLAQGAARALCAHSWPGNIRELEKALELAVARTANTEIALESLPEILQREPPDAGDDAGRREELIRLLRQHRGNVSATAAALGKARMQIQRWLKRYDIDIEQFRS
ncbi:MAG: sigma 54-interacting transcriptional regulator [Polyangiaceae bacterium]